MAEFTQLTSRQRVGHACAIIAICIYLSAMAFPRTTFAAIVQMVTLYAIGAFVVIASLLLLYFSGRAVITGKVPK